MARFVVYLEKTNKQIKVFHYDLLDSDNLKQAKRKAIDFAIQQENNGYPCTIEQFHLLESVGHNIKFKE